MSHTKGGESNGESCRKDRCPNKASIALAKKLGASYIGCKSTFDMLKKSEVSNETKTEAEQFDKMLYRIYR